MLALAFQLQIILYLNGSSLYVGIWRNNNCVFQHYYEIANLTDLAEVLQKYPCKIGKILINSENIVCRIEQIPHVQAKDLHAVIERRFQQNFQTNPYRTTFFLKSIDKTKDQYLFVALNEYRQLEQYVQFFQEHGLKLKSIYLTALLMQAVLKKNDIGRQFGHVLLIEDFGETLQISFFREGFLQFSRSVSLSSPVTREILLKEIDATKRLLLKQKIWDGQSALTMALPDWMPTLQAVTAEKHIRIKPIFGNTVSSHHLYAEVLSRLALRSKDYGDLLVLFADKNYHKLLRYLVLIVWGVNISLGGYLINYYLHNKAEVIRLTRQIEQNKPSLPSVGSPPTLLEGMTTLRYYQNLTPERLMIVVSQLIRDIPEIQLETFDWKLLLSSEIVDPTNASDKGIAIKKLSQPTSDKQLYETGMIEFSFPTINSPKEQRILLNTLEEHIVGHAEIAYARIIKLPANLDNKIPLKGSTDEESPKPDTLKIQILLMPQNEN